MAKHKQYQHMILKVQKPLFGTGPAEALVYNEDRSLTTMLPWSKTLDAVFGDDEKQYWLCDVPLFDKGYIQMLEQVEEQDW